MNTWTSECLPGQKAPVRFTFFWTAVGRWEGRDFQVGVDREGGKGQFKPSEEAVAQGRRYRRGGVGRMSSITTRGGTAQP